jgi:hypothetical protein
MVKIVEDPLAALRKYDAMLAPANPPRRERE